MQPYLASVKYQFYAGSNVAWSAAQWDAEFASMASVRVKRVTIRNPLDSFFPGYSVRLSNRSAACDKNYTAFFDIGALANDSCVHQWSSAPSHEQPLSLLIDAAARWNISVLLGLAWAGSAPSDVGGLRSLALLQQRVASQLVELYGDALTPPPAPRMVVTGAYTEVEFNNCHDSAFASAYVAEYLAPVSSFVATLLRSRAPSAPEPFLYADPYYEPAGPSKPNCASAASYGDFWRRAFAGAPDFSLVAPQDGTGAHNLSAAVVTEYLSALRNGSHAAGRRFGALVELFEQYPLGTYHQPTCEHRRPAPWARVKAQLSRDGAVADDGELTAWEWHSYLSPLPGPCAWARDRNASVGLFAQYKAYVDSEVFGQGAAPSLV
jgi:hypothetical protein